MQISVQQSVSRAVLVNVPAGLKGQEVTPPPPGLATLGEDVCSVGQRTHKSVGAEVGFASCSISSPHAAAGRGTSSRDFPLDRKPDHHVVRFHVQSDGRLM